MRAVARLALIGIAAVAAIVLVRTAVFTADDPAVEPAPTFALRAGAAERLATAIRIPTITPTAGTPADTEPFAALHAYLRAEYPLVHAAMRREPVGDASALFTWAGSDATLDALLLSAHVDVVPIETGAGARWTYPPFSGAIADGFVWGRGALDDKASVFAIFEALESLCARGFRPARTLLVALGHDEEAGGAAGAARIAGLLRQRRTRVAVVLDEGGVIADGLLPGLRDPVALVGLAEKGSVTVQLTARGPGGHSSMPPANGPIGALSEAIARLEANQMPPRLAGPTRALFDRIGPRLPFVQRAAIANLWLAEPLLLRRLAASPSTNAAIRTTTAVTMFDAGVTPNVLPAEARAVVNFRVLPGDTTGAVLEHVRQVVADPAIAVAPVGPAFEPSPVSSTGSGGYRALARAIRATMPEVVVAPYLVPGATDARHYRDVAIDAYRFLPLRLTPADVERLHGVDERVSIAQYEQAIAVYRTLIEEYAGAAAPSR
ncbi:MAG: M20 family peptidase [Acidobacteria bacterium]|nr:M20 family peptidase [Acidobacteriota bacterium]